MFYTSHDFRKNKKRGKNRLVAKVALVFSLRI